MKKYRAYSEQYYELKLKKAERRKAFWADWLGFGWFMTKTLVGVVLVTFIVLFVFVLGVMAYKYDDEAIPKLQKQVTELQKQVAQQQIKEVIHFNYATNAVIYTFEK